MTTHVWIMLRLALSLVGLACPAGAADWAGPARIVDHHTLSINGRPLRLSGIVPAPSDRVCYDSRYTVFYCDYFARIHLDHLISNRQVACSGADEDWYRLPRVHCTADELDLSREMVRAGWATVDGSGKYRAEQDLARQERVGVWSFRRD